MLIKINTVLANLNNTRPSLISNSERNLQALASCGSLGHDIRYIYCFFVVSFDWSVFGYV